MNRRDRIRRQWTHRRLGLGATIPADAAMASTEALLAAVGGRSTSRGSTADAFESALFDFACDIDLAAGVADLERRPLPTAVLRLGAAPLRKRRLGWQVLLPALGGSLAAIVATVTLLIGGAATSGAPALSATAESRQLLSHAGLLLTAARHATTAERAELVTEAEADLTHVARLLPLAPPPERPAIRSQMNVLNHRAEPLASPPADSTRRGTDRPGDAGTGATQRPAPEQQTARSSSKPAPSSTPPHTRPAAGTDTGTQPPPSDISETQQTGTRPPPPSGPTTQGGYPPDRQTQTQPGYGGGNQPPPPGQQVV